MLSVKTKLLNHLTKNGEKKTSEKILFKSLKKLQKDSSKPTKDVLKTALVLSTPVFKVHVIENKKQRKKNRKIKKIPYFIVNNNSRISLAIKFIMKSINNKVKPLYSKLQNEILWTSQQKGDSINFKKELQKQVLINKKYFNFYKWK
nr:ribosomal protein S7 [Gomphonema parvulum]